MKALFLSKYRRLEIVDWSAPRLGLDEVMIRAGACGSCGSDVHGYNGPSVRPIPPLVMGHEAGGTLAELGSPGKPFSVGCHESTKI